MTTTPPLDRPIRGLILDIDGTLAISEEGSGAYTALPGARPLLSALRNGGIPVCAFTNGTFHTPAEYCAKLAAAGIEIPVDRILTPASVAADHFAGKDIQKALVLGGAGVVTPLNEAGIETIAPGRALDGVQAVLVGWYPQFALPDIEAACDAIWAGAPLFVTSDAPFFATRKGRMLGVSGAIGAMITSVTGRRAMVLGKPAMNGLRAACRLMGVRPSNVAVVGDDPLLEITMARRSRACAIGVLSGLAKREDFLALPPNRAAHFVFDSLLELLDSKLIAGATAVGRAA